MAFTKNLSMKVLVLFLAIIAAVGIISALVDGGSHNVAIGSREKMPRSGLQQRWRTDFLKAADDGNLHVIKSLIDKRARVDVRDEARMTPLMIAATHGYLSIVEALISAGADVNAQAVDGYTVIMYACFGTVDVVEALLSGGADVNGTGEEGMNAIFLAASLEKYDIVDVLESSGGEMPDPHAILSRS